MSKLILNADSEDELQGHGYQLHAAGRFFLHLIIACSAGLAALLFHWKPNWKIALFYTRCSVKQARLFFLKNQYKQQFIIPVTTDYVDEHMSTPYFFMVDEHRNDESRDHHGLLVRSQAMRQVFQYIDHHNVRYIWNADTEQYVRLHGLEEGVKCMHFHEEFKGHEILKQAALQVVYGRNEIEVEVKSYPRLFFEEVLNPFYIFQVFSITLWMSDAYYYYAATIFFISVVTIGVSLYETKKQSVTLRNMVRTPEQRINVYRGSEVKQEVSNFDLVPGDIIEIPSGGSVMYCDAVLLTGNCIVNEAMLTGESVPVTKTPLPHTADHEMYSPNEYKRHTLFSGTHILQTRYYGGAEVKAVVIRTGFQTAKGELVRSIMYPKPMDFKFYQDATRFIMVLACVASIGVGVTIYIMINYDRPTGILIRRCLDIITIVVPPALPAAMTVGMVYAQGRLKRQDIFCISPPRINLCGKLKLFCFDKTGTLTEDGLDLWGMLPLTDGGLHYVCQSASDLKRGPYLTAMAACHSLTRIDGVLNGDPLDLKMFEATGWTLEEPGEDSSRTDCVMPTIVYPSHAKVPYEIGVVKQFTFSSGLQRMSVITQCLGQDQMELHVKGAPEKIASLCIADSLPSDYAQVLQHYTMQGFRVIAFAHKQLLDLSWHRAQRITREELEFDLTFSGFLIMQNALKKETTPIITQLRRANIRTVMVTGDNILTAISVARECAMVSRESRVIQVRAHPPTNETPAAIEWVDQDLPFSDKESSDHCDMPSSYQRSYRPAPLKDYHLAVDGKSFAVLLQYFPSLVPKVCLKGTVFARMAPEQKAQLVEQLQSLGYGVGMCGDGANDCSALKAAHAGVSLSEAEASVASPFTSRKPNIECVPTLIREGRAALTTSFGCFKYMALYSLIQFTSVVILYSAGTNLGDKEFLYIDLVITTTLAFLMGHTSAYHKMVHQRPRGSLMSFANLTSIFSQIIFMILFQIVAFYYLHRQPWFKPTVPWAIEEDNNSQTWESTTIFITSNFMYLSLSFNFSIGPPYRKRIWSNKPYFVANILLLTACLVLLFYPPTPVESFLRMRHLDQVYGFRVVLLLLVAIHFMTSFITETFVLESLTFNKLSRCLRRKKRPNNLYKIVAMELEADPLWPPVGKTTTEVDCISHSSNSVPME